MATESSASQILQCPNPLGANEEERGGIRLGLGMVPSSPDDSDIHQSLRKAKLNSRQRIRRCGVREAEVARAQ